MGRRASFFGALVVLAVALAFGAGIASHAHDTPAQRAARLDAVIRCPSCADISVAQSNAGPAIAVRHEILRLVQAGKSDHAIENQLVRQYGPSILLEPPASGLSSLVWLLPLAAAVLALGALIVYFSRRSSSWRRLRSEGAPS